VVFCAFIEDISERKRIEEAVLASEKRYRALFESNPLPILLYEPDTLRILAVNPAAVRHYGYSEWEFRDRSLPDLWAHEEPGAARGDAPAGGGARHRTKGGRVFDTEVTAQAIEYAGRPARIAVVQDVTERHQEEERLRQAEERFEKAFRASPAAMSITTLKEARFLDVNEAFTRLTGWRREEVVGRTSFELGTWIDAGERAEFIARLSRDGAVRRMPIRLQGADGVERLIVISGQVIELAGERCVLAQTEEVVR
jgi:PAS domain S-box-containing protein